MEYSDKFLEDLSEALMGGNSIGHGSLIAYCCEEHGYDLIEWHEALELLQSEGYEIDECPACGWVNDGNYYEHPDYEEGVCSDCEE